MQKEGSICNDTRLKLKRGEKNSKRPRTKNRGGGGTAASPEPKWRVHHFYREMGRQVLKGKRKKGGKRKLLREADYAKQNGHRKQTHTAEELRKAQRRKQPPGERVELAEKQCASQPHEERY